MNQTWNPGDRVEVMSEVIESDGRAIYAAKRRTLCRGTVADPPTYGRSVNVLHDGAKIITWHWPEDIQPLGVLETLSEI